MVALFASAGIGTVVAVIAWLAQWLGSEAVNLALTDGVVDDSDALAAAKVRRSIVVFTLAVVADAGGAVLAAADYYSLAQLGLVALGAAFYLWSLRASWGESGRGKTMIRAGTALLLAIAAMEGVWVLIIVTEGGVRWLW